MKCRLTVALALASLSAGAQVVEQTSPPSIERFLATLPEIRVTHELTAKGGYVAPANTELYGKRIGKLEEVHGSLDYVLSPEISKTFLPRLGLSWERFSFGHQNAMPVPNQLQTAAVVVGFDATLADDWLLRFEARPGVYTDFTDVQDNDVNVPFIVGASWLYSTDLQFFGGISVDFFREYPILPGLGFRWRFAEDWTLMFILPEPKLIYDVDKDLQVFAGIDVKSTNVRVSRTFGDSIGRSDLNNAVLSLSEVRAGAGVIYKVADPITVQLEGGYMVYRKFDFFRANFDLESNPAPYAQVSVIASF